MTWAGLTAWYLARFGAHCAWCGSPGYQHNMVPIFSDTLRRPVGVVCIPCFNSSGDEIPREV